MEAGEVILYRLPNSYVAATEVPGRLLTTLEEFEFSVAAKGSVSSSESDADTEGANPQVADDKSETEKGEEIPEPMTPTPAESMESDPEDDCIITAEEQYGEPPPLLLRPVIRYESVIFEDSTDPKAVHILQVPARIPHSETTFTLSIETGPVKEGDIAYYKHESLVLEIRRAEDLLEERKSNEAQLEAEAISKREELEAAAEREQRRLAAGYRCLWSSDQSRVARRKRKLETEQKEKEELETDLALARLRDDVDLSAREDLQQELELSKQWDAKWPSLEATLSQCETRLKRFKKAELEPSTVADGD